MLIGRDEAELVAQPVGPDDAGRTVVGRNHDRQVEGNLPIVKGDETATCSVHLARVELRDQFDVPLRQHPSQTIRCHRLGEGTVEGGHIGQVDAVADAALAEEPVGEEAELQRCHRALDG